MQHVEDAPGYRVLDQAGQGGFAIVYRAYQERLDRVVALKVLSVDRVDSKTMRRFQRELQLTGRLTGHPNVVTVFDTGTTRSGKPYIAMDFFENGSLRDRIRNHGALPLQEVLRAGVKLAGALAAVHEAGVLHGDIKPQNILISRYGEPAIADFGVARVIDTAEVSAATHAFTPLHAAPEVLSGQPHSAATDIYSLGSTLYHLLAGQPAFHSPTDPSIAPLMYRVLSTEPPPINRADVPPVVFATVLRAMAKNPQQRYGTARAFAERLREVQAELGLPVTDLLGADPGPAPTSSTIPRPHADPADTPSGPPTFPVTHTAQGTAPATPGGPAHAPLFPPDAPASAWAPPPATPQTPTSTAAPWTPTPEAPNPWGPPSDTPNPWAPDTAAAQADTPNRWPAHPEAGQPGVGQSWVGQPGVGQPGVGQPGVGQPGVGQPGVGQPGVGQPGVGQPGVGQPTGGQPGVGQPTVGQPTGGQPGAEHLAGGMPPVGQPGAGFRGYANPGGTHPSSTQEAGAHAAGAHAGGGYPSGAHAGDAHAAGAHAGGGYPAGSHAGAAYPAGADAEGAYPTGARTGGGYPSGADTEGGYSAGADAGGSHAGGVGSGGQQAGGAVSSGGRRRRAEGSGRGKVVVGVAVAAVALAGSGLAVYLSQRPPTSQQPTANRTHQKQPSTPAVDRQALDALRPRALKVTGDAGVSVTLSWRLPADARKYPVVVQREPADGQQLTPLAAGTTSTRLTGLTKGTGYCFIVGVPLQISAKTSVAWSKPVCVRGAKPKAAQLNGA